MSRIEWKDEYSVGNAAVDHEHKELIGLISELQRTLESDFERDHVVETLGEVYAQIAAHFALEEKSMRDSRYPDYGDHKSDHEALLDQLRDIMDRVEDGDTSVEQWLSDQLGEWFSNHFRTHDAKLHRRR